MDAPLPQVEADEGRLPVAVSLGDPEGIGPEVLALALGRLSETELAAGGRLVVYGHTPALERALGSRLSGSLRDLVELSTLEDPTGAVALRAAVDALAEGRARSLVTGPIDKGRVADVLGEDFVGQTEYVAGRLGCRGREVMMLGCRRLRVALLTTHVALRQVAERIDQAGTLRVLLTVHEDLRRWFGIPEPRLALAALNPHAGEGGRFGDEEQRILIPAVEQARRRGLQVDGPLPADAMFFHAVQGRWDAVVACYHDQGLAPLKAVAFHESINMTLGLPRLRVSPDHGVARDLVGKELAHPGSTIEALRMALSVPD